MSVIGKIESVWRYPVKSMKGEAVDQAFIGFSGVYGDRVYAFKTPAAPAGFPYHTAREQEDLLLYTPKFRNAPAAAKPENLAEADDMAPGMTPLYAGFESLDVEVTTPDGAVFGIDTPELVEDLRKRLGDALPVSLLRSERALTDCRPVSMFSLQTVAGLAEEIGEPVDKRQFRANLYADFSGETPFFEKTLIGKRIKVGAKAELMVIENDPRCKMITLNPDTGAASPKVLRQVTTKHGGVAGLYTVVLVEGMVAPGDVIELV
jgi:uncharacterized protein YcbX